MWSPTTEGNLIGPLAASLGVDVSIVAIATTMREILGLTINSNYTSTFSTQQYLTSPMNIDFISSQLQIQMDMLFIVDVIEP